MPWNKVQEKIQWWYNERSRIMWSAPGPEQKKRLEQAERELARWCQKAMRGEKW